ncbi:plexin domain-containing protein 1-like isoform X2 [Coregonus clupeaformis]|uniref:plexin domain-containing protein 1-like isoform X2 n=1 Tax=Coregonus clupeaformis TaxID=59861 RepID=UPI001E1C9BA3|nr:plexin domain-containing protein 1-like isoform X2 [Coregonus clupeaformis]
MCLSALLLICLSQTELGRVWAQQQTEMRYHVNGQRHEKPSHRTPREPRLGYARVAREVLGGGLTIDTLPDNMTHLVEDAGRYYTWRSFGPDDQRTDELWVDLNDLEHGQVRMHGILSNTHRQAAKVALSFDFPFYGHYLRQITIATGGFIFMGEVTHRMLTATQYIAPLMANFDPSFSKESTVQYLDNGEVFVVQWERVRLHGREAEGAYTFQAALHLTGTITFSYRDIPLPVEVISSAEHQVKTGLSDAFMVNLPSTQSSDAQRRLYEYHRVDIDTTKITNNSAFEFTALPSKQLKSIPHTGLSDISSSITSHRHSLEIFIMLMPMPIMSLQNQNPGQSVSPSLCPACLQHDSCELCLLSNLTSGCTWCNVLQRCSDGMDRHRQEWLDYACSEEAEDVTCEDYSRGGPDSSIDPSVPSDSEVTTPLGSLLEGPATENVKTGPQRQHDGSAHTGVIAGVVAALVLLLAVTLLALYINSHPSAASPLYFLQLLAIHEVQEAGIPLQLRRGGG